MTLTIKNVLEVPKFFWLSFWHQQRQFWGLFRNTLSLTSFPNSILYLKRSNYLNLQKPSGGPKIFVFESQALTKTVLGVSRNTLSMISIPKSILDCKRSNDVNHQEPSGGAIIWPLQVKYWFLDWGQWKCVPRHPLNSLCWCQKLKHKNFGTYRGQKCCPKKCCSFGQNHNQNLRQFLMRDS